MNILHLKDQPTFPNEDLTEANAEMIDYYFGVMNETGAGAEHYMQTMRMVYRTAHSALMGVGLSPTEGPAEYMAFCRGYATFDVMTLMVNMDRPRGFDMELAARRFKQTFLDAGDLADLELAVRRSAWANSYPNAYGVTVNDGSRKGETMAQLQARTMGAQVACDLQTQ